MSPIETVIEDPAWDGAGLPDLAARAARALYAHLGLGAEWEATVLACDDARIATLNADFRGKPRPTNVLSWPSGERGAAVPGGAPRAPVPDAFGDTHLGDIALAHGVCHAEARDQGKAPADHLTHLLVHGLLHLLGYDHETDADAARMESIEREVLGIMGLPDPYMDNEGPAPAAQEL